MTDTQKASSTHSRCKMYEDDDKEDWIPLVQPAAAAATTTTTTTAAASRPTTTKTSSTFSQESNSNLLGNTMNRSSSVTERSIMAVQNRLERNIHLKANLVDHPIDHFWKRFLVNFASELWRLDLRIRIGLSLIVIGFILKIFLLSTWYLWHPRLALFVAIGVVSFAYLDPLNVRSQFAAFLEALFDSPGRLLEGNGPLNPTQLRRICLVLLMYPTALEIHTISFLTSVHVESGWFQFTTLVSGIILWLMMHLLQTRHCKPRETIHKGLLMLYSSALLITILKANLRRIPKIAAPFCSATGTLLVTYNDDDMEWLSRTLRSALRLSLRDVLSSISGRVNEDEMLQLAIIRWIVDYWSSAPTNSTSDNAPPNETSEKSSNRPDQSFDNLGQRTAAGDVKTPAASSTPSSSDHNPVHWNELRPMLDIATNQMSIEVNSLQSPSGRQSASQNSYEATANVSQESCPTKNDSVDNLRTMLMSLDVDERGPSAVEAYRKAVDSFPPTQNFAIGISVARRCPAFLALMLRLFMGLRGPITTIVVLLPFIVLEYFRVRAWMQTCSTMANVDTNAVLENVSENYQHMSSVDSMVILLSGDNDNPLQPPTLVLVWQNIQSSVSALEVGLTATRCIQTTSVAVDFAGNIMSLVQLGYEVKELGLIHGLASIGKEIYILNASESSSQQDRTQNLKYTGAAMDAIRNSQIVARNLQILLEDEKVSPLLSPVVGMLRAISGHGWLWGHEENVQESENAQPDDSWDQQQHPPPNQQNTESSEQPNSQTPEGCSHDQPALGGNDLSPVMELVLRAYEEGRIDSAEKNEFCEKLANLSEDELMNSAVIDGMKRSLEIVLEIADSDPPNTDVCCATPNEETPILELVEIAYARGVIVEAERSAFSDKIANLAGTDPTIVRCMRRALEALLESYEEIHIDRCGEPEPASLMPQSPTFQTKTDTDDSSHLSDPGISKPGYNHAPPTISMKPEPCAVSNREIQSTASSPSQDEDIETKLKGGTSRTAATSATEDSDTAKSDRGDVSDDGNDAWMKFGIAALGLVVGGVVISMQGGENEDESCNTHRDQRNTSTVEIEELSDNGDDEWVSVEPSRREQ